METLIIITDFVVISDQVSMETTAMVILADSTNEVFLTKCTEIAQTAMLDKQLIEMQM